MMAIEALREAGATVVGVAVVVDRGSAARIAHRGFPVFSLFSVEELFR